MSTEGSTSSSSVPPGQDPADVVTPQSLLTQELVETALRADKGPDAQLGSWECKDFTRPGDNYACVVSSVVVDYTQGVEEFQVTYIVKLNPRRGLDMFEVFTHAIFLKEGLFYRDIVPELNRCLQEAGVGALAVPKFIHVHLEKKSEVIFLEDLRPQGFKMFDRKKGQDFAHAKLILKELARLHAASVLLQTQNPEISLMDKFPFLEDIWTSGCRLDRETLKAMTSNNLLGAKSIAESTPGYEHVVKWIEDVAPNTIDILCEHAAPSSPALTVLNHGDCWVNNLLFRYNADDQPVEAILLDLQVTRLCDPGCDLNYYLYSSFNGEDRNAHLEDYLDTYYDFFKQVLDASEAQVPYTRHELVDNYEKHNMFGVMIGMTFVPILLIDSEDVMDLSKINEENLKEAMEEFGQASIKVAKGNPLAQSRVLCLFDDLVKQGKIPSK